MHHRTRQTSPHRWRASKGKRRTIDGKSAADAIESCIIKYDKAVGLKTVFRSSASGDQQYEVDLDEDGNFEFQVVDESEPWLSIYGYLDSGIYLASMSGDSLKQFKDRFTGSPEREGTYFQLKKVTADIGPLEFSLNKQLVDDRNWGERLFDWYYFGE